MQDATKWCTEWVLCNDVQSLCNRDGQKGWKVTTTQDAKFAFGYTTLWTIMTSRWWWEGVCLVYEAHEILMYSCSNISVHENHRTRRTFPMAGSECPMDETQCIWQNVRWHFRMYLLCLLRVKLSIPCTKIPCLLRRSTSCFSTATNRHLCTEFPHQSSDQLNAFSYGDLHIHDVIISGKSGLFCERFPWCVWFAVCYWMFSNTLDKANSKS